MTDWKRVLRAIAPKGKSWIINGVADAMPQMIQIAKLTTLLRQAQFLAQCAHESDGFQTTKEYASGAAYEGRADIGNTQRGDGVRFKGRGIIQNTGRGSAKKPLSGYNLVSAALGVDFVSKPELLEKFPYAALAAAVFWTSKRLNAAADRDDVNEVTRLVNGGHNGLAQRKAYLKAAKRALAAPQPKAAPSEEQATAQDLRKTGSRTMAGTDQIKKNLATGVGTVVLSGGADYLTRAADATQTASNAAQNASDIAAHVQNIHEATKSAPTMFVVVLGWVRDHPGVMVGVNIALAIVLAYCVWRIFNGVGHVERAKVDDVNAELAGGE